jgi:hypothetical protein
MTQLNEGEILVSNPPDSIVHRQFKISQVFFYLFHPLLIPTLVSLALFLRSDLFTIILPIEMKLWFITVVCGFTLIIPAFSSFVLMRFKLIDSPDMEQRNDRILPLVINSASYLALLFSLKSNNIPPLLLYVIYSVIFAILAGLVINLFYQISLHTLGWSALATILISLSIRIGIPLLGLIISSLLISGIVGYAVLNQNARHNSRVYSGYATGILVILLVSLFG